MKNPVQFVPPETSIVMGKPLPSMVVVELVDVYDLGKEDAVAEVIENEAVMLILSVPFHAAN